MMPNPADFATEWINAWNSHDLDRILSLYADDVEVTTPMIKVALGIDDGTVRGRDAAGQYWSAALRKVPNLHFELVEATRGVNSIAIYYKSILGKTAIETMFFKVNKAIAHYNSGANKSVVPEAAHAYRYLKNCFFVVLIWVIGL